MAEEVTRYEAVTPGDEGLTSDEYTSIVDSDVLDVQCGPCAEDGKQRDAVGVCTDCRDYLCTECYEAHKRAKPSKKHVLERTVSLPKPTKGTASENCQEHKNEFLAWFCVSDDKAICDICKRVDHRNCSNVKSLTNVSKNFLTSGKLKQVTDRLHQLQTDFKKELPEILAKAREVEMNYDAAIDEVIKSISKIKDEDMDKLKALETTCDSTVKTIGIALNEIESLKDRGEELDAFIAARKAEIQLNTFEDRLTSVRDDNNITRYRYEENLEPNVDRMIGQICTVAVEIDPVCIGDIDVNRNPLRIGNINVKTPTDSRNCWITSIERLSDTRSVIADSSNSKIKLVDLTSKTVTSEVELKMHPWDMSKVSDDMIAVTTYGNQKLLFVSISNTLTVEETIDKSRYSQCLGIVHSNNTLSVSYHGPDQIEILNVDGTVKHVIENKDTHGTDRFGEVRYLTQVPDTNILYLSDTTNHRVSSMTQDGRVISRFTHEQLNGPRGIAVCRDGRICVCSHGTNTIFEISSDLSEGRVILDEKDGISGPYSIVYSVDERKLFIGNDSNTIKVYRM